MDLYENKFIYNLYLVISIFTYVAGLTCLSAIMVAGITNDLYAWTIACATCMYLGVFVIDPHPPTLKTFKERLALKMEATSNMFGSASRYPDRSVTFQPTIVSVVLTFGMSAIATGSTGPALKGLLILAGTWVIFIILLGVGLYRSGAFK